MCGIAGIVGENASEERMNLMLLSQKHRGPDFTGKYIAKEIVLGHNRLKIIDLSEAANQPFYSEGNRYILIFNGEIYNYLELKEELQNEYDFKTASDTEVLLAAYLKWGKDCLSKLNGMFSFAIWDSQEKKLFAARDRFGVKPFYYHHKNKAFYFSSEIKALHAAGIPKIHDEKVWASYFAFGSYGNPDETFWEGIQQLQGGHYLDYQKNQLSINKWYFFEQEVAKQPKNLSYNEAKEQYLTLLKDSIKLRFRADVPVGFNISGGLDSSVLLALVNDHRCHPEPDEGLKFINAYTFFTNNPDYDELPWVEQMISKTNNPLTKVLLKADEVPDYANKMAWQQDEPYGGIPTLAYAKLFEQARKDNVLVLLDGQGMDEQWAGYDYYTQQNEVTIQGVTDSPFKTKVLSKSFLKKAVKPMYPKPFKEEVLNKQYRDLFFTKIPRALRFNDRISMAYTTELREPFLDYRLVEFAFSLPLAFKIKEGVTKYMLREIASEYLADDLAFTPKRVLQTPQREWIGNELKEFVNSQLEKINVADTQNWFDKRALMQEWKNYLDGDNDSSFHIWQWVSLGLILNEN
ncbi:MAG: asparagine synthase (glutamine-hydrolyzing) [Flavobacteria bacterium RIFCSPLOWO2_12_FULL_35_11]|nr:MAG: asparagine synthase (glutamine-hydrolyzing) [Flavobacteria bacterium RIFCSPLOWO2_12_FULL_35_11]